MLVSGCSLVTVQLDARRDLVGVGGAVAQSSVDLRPCEDRVLDERGKRIRLSCQILHPHHDLPYVGPAKQPCTSARRSITKRDQRMLLATRSFLGVATQAI